MLRPLISFYRNYVLRLDVSGLLAMLGVAVGCANIIALIGVTESGRHQAMSVLADAGAPVLDEAPRPGAHGTSVAFVHPKYLGGVLAELVQDPKPDATS